MKFIFSRFCSSVNFAFVLPVLFFIFVLQGASRQTRFFILLPLLMVFVFQGAFAQAYPNKRMELDPPIKSELSKILKESETLHGYLFEGKDPMVLTQLKLLRKNIQDAMPVFDKQPGKHISKILMTVNTDISGAQDTLGSERAKYIKGAFKQIVLLYQTYKVDDNYKVFFCKHDRSVWIQQSRKPQNPFEMSSQCARLVN